VDYKIERCYEWYVHGHEVNLKDRMGDRMNMGNMKNGGEVHGSVSMLSIIYDSVYYDDNHYLAGFIITLLE